MLSTDNWLKVNPENFNTKLCSNISAIFDNFHGNVTNTQIWIDNIVYSRQSGCVLYVDWNPNRHTNLHMKLVLDKVDSLANRIYNDLNKKEGFSDGNVDFIGFQEGAYVAAKVARKFTGKIKKLYAIAPPKYGLFNNKLYYGKLLSFI